MGLPADLQDAPASEQVTGARGAQQQAAEKRAFPDRRAAAQRNRAKILGAARSAFADPTAEISMAEIARRAQVGMATLHRDFPGRQEPLEALYADEVDQICDAARIEPGQPPEAPSPPGCARRSTSSRTSG